MLQYEDTGELKVESYNRILMLSRETLIDVKSLEKMLGISQETWDKLLKEYEDGAPLTKFTDYLAMVGVCVDRKALARYLRRKQPYYYVLEDIRRQVRIAKRVAKQANTN